MTEILISNIQRFSLHDGPGIRTTVFLKGCSLHCPWCSNPENYVSIIQPYIKDGENGVYGKYMSYNQIYDEVIKDKAFYDEDGGVTFSGGEALLQIKQMEPLFDRLKIEGIHIAVETALFVPKENLEIAIKYVDLFYVDIKILDKEQCREIEGGDLDSYLSNLGVLFKSCKNVIFRIPVICNYTDIEENREKVIELIGKYRPMEVEIIKGHNLGAEKRKSLRLDDYQYVEVEDNVLDNYKQKIEAIGVRTKICKI